MLGFVQNCRRLKNHLRGFYIRHGCAKLFLEQASHKHLWMYKPAQLLGEETSAQPISLAYLCWHQDLQNCTIKLTRNHPAGNKPNNKFIPPRPQLSAVQPDLFIELSSPSGLQKEVKVTALQKGCLPALFTVRQAQVHLGQCIPGLEHFLGPQQGVGEEGEGYTGEKPGHRECLC